MFVLALEVDLHIGHAQQHTTEVIDQVSRFVWSFPEIEVLDEERTWLS
jgi:uncharacterized protein YlxP (DUF503 family)